MQLWIELLQEQNEILMLDKSATDEVVSKVLMEEARVIRDEIDMCLKVDKFDKEIKALEGVMESKSAEL